MNVDNVFLILHHYWIMNTVTFSDDRYKKERTEVDKDQLRIVNINRVEVSY